MAFEAEFIKSKENQLVSDKTGDEPDALLLEDVEDELIKEDVVLSLPPSMFKLQTVSKPMDLSLAKELKTLLFGSTFCCFSEEWKLQNFSFNDNASLKYGIVQNKAGCSRAPQRPFWVVPYKGGPCGVLAAVQGCVLQKLLFEGDSRTNSNLLSLIAHLAASTALPVQELRVSRYQFEVGPYGCILLTLSAILSRSLELMVAQGPPDADAGFLARWVNTRPRAYEDRTASESHSVRQDFDVPTSHLIGAHGYCTQELVNLLLTGRAVSNVFNDVVELDSGDGDITLLRGIEARSNIGFLSLFEHYNVGCFLKTPRFPIWVVCSESHFSILFSLQPELLSDWRTERLFDLYYYDGLANQQEEIRLTVDTTKTSPEDSCSDLVPPLELCIRTNCSVKKQWCSRRSSGAPGGAVGLQEEQWVLQEEQWGLQDISLAEDGYCGAFQERLFPKPVQLSDEMDFSQEGNKGKMGMADRSEEHRRPDCYGSILMPLLQALDHVSFLLSAPVSPRTLEQMVSGSLLLKLYNTTRQRQEMSKKGQGSREQEAKLQLRWAQSREGTQSEEVLPNRLHT
ncbi:hypothetical protein A6R68_02704 [Neotoma lepida]|uniref:Ubiquitin carboxyl-terminal hydrolase MINDY n=1 Tax=Neotoma lepida TaxID=56216 RepID=A0A1A6GSV1_NEOLE|nr:hypothetical protein A6R68_02704 [Neotoma lepida]